MPTLERLIDSLGPPPPEVCIDWAWQLASAFDDNLDSDLDWSQIDLLESGELQIIREPTSREFESQRPVLELPASQPHVETRACDLIDFLLRWSTATDVAAADELPHPRPSSAGQLARLLERRTYELAQCNPDAQAAIVLPTVLMKVVESEALLRNRKKPVQTKGLLRNPFAWLAACLVCVLTVPLAVNLLSRNFATVKVQTSAVDAAAQIQGNAQTSLARDASETIGKQEQTQLVPWLQTTQGVLGDEPQLDGAVVEHDALPQNFGLPGLDSVGSASAGGEHLAGQLSDSGEELSPVQAEIHGMADDAMIASLAAANSSQQLVGSKQIDVLEEMQRVAGLAGTQEQASEIAERDDGTRGKPALLIGTAPMLQIQRLSNATQQRIRKPEWRIRLSPATEGCRVVPEGAQTVSGRDTVRWCIAEEAADEPRTQLVVVAGLLHGRDAGLRWRIAAGSEDLPHIVVPLGQDHLDALYAGLSQACRRLQNQIEQLQLLGKTSGLPADLRAAASAQRKECDAQEKLGRRMLQIVADAHRLQDLLDSQFEVHAEVFDQSRLGSTALLQFGQPYQSVPENTAVQTSSGSASASGRP